MELTPQLFRDVQFSERRGAYDKDEVDAFLARVGTAVGQLQDRLRDTRSRLDASEARIGELEAAGREEKDADETLRRTLVLAQRTADAAVQEAKDESESIVADARKRADEMIVQAEEAVRRDVGATRDRLEAEIRELERHRNAMLERIEVVGAHLESERVRLHGELDHLKSALDDPSRLQMSKAPGSEPQSMIPLSEPGEHQGQEEHRGDQPAGEPAVDWAGDSSDGDSDEDLSHLPPPPEDWQTPATPEPDEQAAPQSHGLFGMPREDEPAGDGGPPTQANPIVDTGTSFGGSHLAELRQAVRSDDTDPESDAAMAAFFDQDSDDEPSRRFGRRR